MRVGSSWLQAASIVRRLYPPDKSKDVNAFNNHVESIGELCSLCSVHDHVLVCGDYNQPKLLWTRNDDELRPANSITLTTTSTVLIDGMDFLNLCQANTERNYLGRTLDLVFGSPDLLPVVLVPASPLVPVDLHHPPLEISLPSINVSLNDSTGGNVTSDLSLDFNKINFDALSVFLAELDWSNILAELNADEMAVLYHFSKLDEHERTDPSPYSFTCVEHTVAKNIEA